MAHGGRSPCLKNIFSDITSQYLSDLREILHEDTKSVHMTAECQKFRILITQDGGRIRQMIKSVGRMGSYRLDHRAITCFTSCGTCLRARTMCLVS